MRRDLISSALAVVFFVVVLGIAYPLLMTGVGQVAFPRKANGSKIEQRGKLLGSTLLAQVYGTPALDKQGKPITDASGNPTYHADPRYFQPRPSATSPVYNAAATTFSNLGPNSTATLQELTSNIHSYLQLEGPYNPRLSATKIPVDAVTTSASGVDPDISQANAAIQARRVAAVRGVPLARVMQLVAENTDGRFLGVLGEPSVNVVKLNLALDTEASKVEHASL